MFRRYNFIILFIAIKFALPGITNNGSKGLGGFVSSKKTCVNCIDAINFYL